MFDTPYVSTAKLERCSRIAERDPCKIGPEDIAVVTQYHAQVLKIRKLLRETGIPKGVMVTSVENIQGQVRFVP